MNGRWLSRLSYDGWWVREKVDRPRPPRIVRGACLPPIMPRERLCGDGVFEGKQPVDLNGKRAYAPGCAASPTWLMGRLGSRPVYECDRREVTGHI